MKNPFIVFILAAMLSCADHKEESISTTSTIDTVAIQQALTDTIIKKDPIVDGGDDQSGDEMQLYYLVSVAEEDDYINLRSIALKASKLLNFKFDSLDRYYNPKKKRVVLPNDHEDEIYAGEYILRRHGDDFVSIEMRNAYADTSMKDDGNTFFYSDTTKMVVLAGMFGERKQADSIANILRKQFKSTKVIASEIFMGCMH